jgi:hypothetical protein
MWQLQYLKEFTLDWLNYLDRTQVEALIFKSQGVMNKSKTPSRRKDKTELREVPLNVRLSKGEIGAKVFTELTQLFKLIESLQDECAKGGSGAKVHFVQYLMYFFKLKQLTQVKDIRYEFLERGLSHLLALNGHLYLVKAVISVLGLTREYTSLDLNEPDHDNSTPLVLALK